MKLYELSCRGFHSSQSEASNLRCVLDGLQRVVIRGAHLQGSLPYWKHLLGLLPREISYVPRGCEFESWL